MKKTSLEIIASFSVFLKKYAMAKSSANFVSPEPNGQSQCRNPRISRKSRNCLDEGMCGYFFHCIFGQKIEKSAN